MRFSSVIKVNKAAQFDVSMCRCVDVSMLSIFEGALINILEHSSWIQCLLFSGGYNVLIAARFYVR